MRIRLTSLVLTIILIMGLVACATPDISEPELDILEGVSALEVATDIDSAIARVDHSRRVMDVIVLNEQEHDRYFRISIKLVLTGDAESGPADFADDVEGILPAIRMVFEERGVQLAKVEFAAIDDDNPDEFLRWRSSDGESGIYYDLTHGRDVVLVDISWNALPRRIEAYVENVELTINTSSGSVIGIYSGDVMDGIPHGRGEFTSQDTTGISWIYAGEFKDGQFHGYGTTEWETGAREEGYFQFGRIFEGRRYDNDGELEIRVRNGAWFPVATTDSFGWSEEFAKSFTVRIHPCFENFNFADYSWFLENHPSDIVLGSIESEETAMAGAEEVWNELFGHTPTMALRRDVLREYNRLGIMPYNILYDEANDVWFVAGALPEGVLGTAPFIFIRGSDGQVLAAWLA